MPDTLLQLSPQRHNWPPLWCRRNPGVSGYSCAMDKWLLLVLAVGAGGAAYAQGAPHPASSHRDSGAETKRAQKRMELRTVLSAERNAEPAAPALEIPPAGRQLSPQERAEMREQLRRFQPVSTPPPSQP